MLNSWPSYFSCLLPPHQYLYLLSYKCTQEWTHMCTCACAQTHARAHTHAHTHTNRSSSTQQSTRRSDLLPSVGSDVVGCSESITSKTIPLVWHTCCLILSCSTLKFRAIYRIQLIIVSVSIIHTHHRSQHDCSSVKPYIHITSLC